MNISEVKGIINDNITSNGAGQITGEVLNSTLMSIVDAIESNEGSTSVTPNWNASEGEAGYIENKPFGFNITETYNYKRDEDETIDGRIDIDMFSFSPNYDEEKGYYIYPDIEMTGSADGTGIIYYLGSLSNLPTYTGYYDYTDGEQWISAESQVDSDYEGLWLEDSDGSQSYYYLHLRLWVSRINYDINVNVGHIIQMSEKYIPDTIVKKSDIDLNKLQYLLNPVNIYQDDIPSNMINNNVEVYYIDQSFVDTRYFTYRLNNAVYAIQSIVYTGDYFEFKIAEGAPHSICKWDIYNGTWTREQ